MAEENLPGESLSGEILQGEVIGGIEGTIPLNSYPSYAIEFWFSQTGTPNSFYILGVLPEESDENGNPTATPLTLSHTPLTAGSRWWYKTRRVMYPDGISAPVYSDFSAIREAVAPYGAIQKGVNMDVLFGRSTVLGLGIQPSTEPQDKPRKAQWIVENPSGRVRSELAVFGSRALRNTTVRRMKTGAGRATFPFNIPIEGTPNGTLAIVLAMLFGQPTTTLSGGTLVTLGANVIVTATTMTVTALPGPIPSGAVLNFSKARTTTTTADAAEGDTSLAVSALVVAIPSGTVLNYGGVWLRTTSNASASATSVAVMELPADIPSGATIAWTQVRYVTTSAAAATSATSIPIVASTVALTSADTALYGFKYRHEWKNQKNYNVGTFSQLVGDFVEVSPGAFANQFEFSVDFDMDTFVTPTLQGNALNKTRRYSLAQTGLDVATVDNLNAFSMIDARFVIDGVASEDVKSVAVNINRNARGKGALIRKRGVSRYAPSITDISLTLSLFYTSDEFEQKYFGQATTQEEEYGITCRVRTIPVSLEFASCPIVEGDLPYEWGIIVPKASIDSDDPEIAGPDEIMEAVTLITNWDSGISSDARIYLVNDMSLADIMTPAGSISPIPENAVTTYTAA